MAKTRLIKESTMGPMKIELLETDQGNDNIYYWVKTSAKGTRLQVYTFETLGAAENVFSWVEETRNDLWRVLNPPTVPENFRDSGYNH